MSAWAEVVLQELRDSQYFYLRPFNWVGPQTICMQSICSTTNEPHPLFSVNCIWISLLTRDVEICGDITIILRKQPPEMLFWFTRNYVWIFFKKKLIGSSRTKLIRMVQSINNKNMYLVPVWLWDTAPPVSLKRSWKLPSVKTQTSVCWLGQAVLII